MIHPTRAACLSVVLLLLSCTGDLGSTLRRHTYPPDFKYLTDEQVRSTMGQMAQLLSRLQGAMETEEDVDESARREIVALLRQLEDRARELGPGGWPSNHPEIRANVGRLRDDLQRARVAASSDPPNYYWAGAVSATCTICHASRI